MSAIKRHKQFLKDFAKISISDNHFAKLVQYIALLLQEMPLPPEAHDHSLEGRWGQYRESSAGICWSSIDFQKNDFAALSVGNGRKRPIPSLLPCEMNFLKVHIR
jgi:mRNA-degrading endonuclease YafQ of YafQ-DinJ toxin-antitoxin module